MLREISCDPVFSATSPFISFIRTIPIRQLMMMMLMLMLLLMMMMMMMMIIMMMMVMMKRRVVRFVS